MALPSFLKRNAPAAPVLDDAAIVQKARTRARRRLIGAAVLLALGVIAFPLLFETQPRPIPVDIPIEIPRKDGLPPLNAPVKSGRVVSGQVTDVPAAAKAEPPAPAPSTPTAAKAQVRPPAVPASAAAASAVAVPGAAAAKEKPAEAAKPASAAASAAAPASGRFVVQVGAFADVTAAREVRLKVEKLGLKTYTQVVETPQGKRIRVRVGPYEKQDDAAKVLERLKAAKLPGAVLTL